MKQMWSRKTVLVLGKGGFGVQLADWLSAAGVAQDVLFLDDQAPDCAGALRDFVDPALRERCAAAYVGLGDNALRVELLEKLNKAGYVTPCFVHPQAAVSPSAILGVGSVVLPFAYVGAQVQTGMGCILNGGCIVDHNVTLGQGVHVAPGAILKAGSAVPDYVKVDSGKILRSPWDRSV